MLSTHSESSPGELGPDRPSSQADAVPEIAKGNSKIAQVSKEKRIKRVRISSKDFLPGIHRRRVAQPASTDSQVGFGSEAPRFYNL